MIWSKTTNKHRRRFSPSFNSVLLISTQIPLNFQYRELLEDRSTTRNSYRRPNTTRTPACIHFTDLNINYDSEFSADELPYSSRYYRSPTRTSEKLTSRDKHVKKTGGGIITKRSVVGSPPPTTYIVMPEPSLSIIDFNIITRRDLEQACKKNKRLI